jgi:hypothetical protein
MTHLGLSSKREVTRTSIRVRTTIAVQVRYLGGRPPYGYRLGDAGPHPNKAHAAWGRRAAPAPPSTRPDPKPPVPADRNFGLNQRVIPVLATGWSHARGRKSRRVVPCCWQATVGSFSVICLFRRRQSCVTWPGRGAGSCRSRGRGRAGDERDRHACHEGAVPSPAQRPAMAGQKGGGHRDAARSRPGRFPAVRANSGVLNANSGVLRGASLREDGCDGGWLRVQLASNPACRSCGVWAPGGPREWRSPCSGSHWFGHAHLPK